MCMGYRELVAIARIRQELRERLMQERVDGVWDLLASLQTLAQGRSELVSEHARWKLRFELLAIAA